MKNFGLPLFIWRFGDPTFLRFEMNIEAEFEFEDEEEIVKTIYESIKEERERGIDEKRSSVDLALNGNTLRVYMRGEDIIRLRAVANTWLRLLKIAEEMIEVVGEHEKSQCQILPNSK
jgi:tRNA threonylcarbamoyladenosine modification (KEOPS) complex  Pcc1 subunit